jgi:hypothetical protein
MFACTLFMFNIEEFIHLRLVASEPEYFSSKKYGPKNRMAGSLKNGCNQLDSL